MEEDFDDLSIKEFTIMQKYAYVTQRALDNDYIGYCYREYSDIKIDSGWRFTYGDEDEEYLENPDNSQTQNLSEMVLWKPAIAQLVNEKQGSEFEWDNVDNAFRKI